MSNSPSSISLFRCNHGSCLLIASNWVPNDIFWEEKKVENFFRKKCFLHLLTLVYSRGIRHWLAIFQHSVAVILLTDSPSHQLVALFCCVLNISQENAARKGGANCTVGGFA